MKRFLLRPLLQAALLATVLAGATYPALDRVPSAHATAGPGILPFAAQQAAPSPSGAATAHPLNDLIQTPASAHVARVQLNAAATTTTLPASADLSTYATPVGNQGQVGSCASWASGYYLRGWYARRAGTFPAVSPQGFEPMYVYSQIAAPGGGSSFQGNFGVLQSQGIDTRAHYTQGDFDYIDRPTAAETTNAAQYKVLGYSNLYYSNDPAQNRRQLIEQAIAGGDPVDLGIAVYPSFYYANSSSYVADSTSGTLFGYHGIFAAAYDAQGVWIENSWGTAYGRNGWVELSWNYVLNAAYEAWLMRVPTPVTPTATSTSVPPTATPMPTNTLTTTNTPTRTITPSNTPSRTSTPASTFTSTSTPAKTSTRTSTPSNTPSRTNTPANTSTRTSTPSNTPSRTSTPANTFTSTSTPSSTPSRTCTPTNTPSGTATRPAATASSTSTATAVVPKRSGSH
jgi:hypothetical protein